MKTSLDEINSRLEMAEKRVGKLEDRALEVINLKGKGKKIKGK